MKETNKFTIAYKLYSIKNGERNLEEETSPEEPFVFISGFGTTIPGFEKNIENLKDEEEFDFTIPCAEAYGEYVAERVIKLPRPEDESQFDLSVGAVIPLQNEDGQRFMGQITAIEANEVTIDLNHPLAGSDLNFVGKVVSRAEATPQEITQLLNMLSGGGCHGGCGGCGGGSCGEGVCGNCGDGGCGDGGCNCDK